MENKISYNGLDDVQFASPYIDVDEWRSQPVRHRYVHGGFEGTQTRFCFYFPEKEKYKGHFFQFISPFVGDEKEAQYQTGEEDKLSFSLLHGAYLVTTNLGGIVNGGDDHTLVYRASACSAQYSRKLAADLYGSHRPYGYVSGGSGGAFKTISCVENTVGVWDGAVPFVIGSPMAIPNVYTVRAHAMRILRNKMEQIKDAMEPGGSKDPYACLNQEEQEALREAELMGFPMKTWCEYDTIGEGALPLLGPIAMQIDPAYCKDFWEKPGYLGTQEGGTAGRDRIVWETRVGKIRHPEQSGNGIADTIDEKNAYGVDEAWKHAMGKGQKLPVFVLEDFPKDRDYLKGMKCSFPDGELKGEQFGVIYIGENTIAIDVGTETRDLASVLAKVKPGDRVVLDNSDYIALQTLHRHQVPGPEFHAWDQFRDNEGKPIYPQRPVLIAPIISNQGAGSVQQGTADCKMIVLESLMDESAFPWQADWFRSLVQKNTGTDGEEKMRLWYMENCMHTDCEEGNGGDHQHIVSYLGALYQALLDLAAWVEDGVAPASSSGYRMNGGQVVMAESAVERKGIQAIVKMTADGGEKAVVRPGQTVSLRAEVSWPEGAGEIDQVLWDFNASNEFLPGGKTEVTEKGNRAVVTHECSFDAPGTYFPVLKVATNRVPGDRFTRVWNLARVRIVVGEEEK